MEDYPRTQKETKNLSLAVPVLTGAVIGAIAISIFVFGAEPDPAWPENWRIKPLLLTPAIAALGGLFYWFMDYLNQKGLNKIIALIIGILGFVAFFWIGMVLGLNGTMWD